MMSAPEARTSFGFIALTVAAVPTGMKAGVRISPRFIEIRPVRAAPSVAEMEKENRGRPNMPPPSRSSQAKSRDVGASALELHLPNLALFGFAEGIVRLFLDDLHARRGVTAAGAQKHTDTTSVRVGKGVEVK